jgi:soluble epoxide hydrolase/lipid-phosphate phosphatase
VSIYLATRHGNLSRQLIKASTQYQQTDLAGVNYIPNVHALQVLNGTKYRYVFYPAIDKPSILFLHGFPSSSYDWREQFQYFHSKGYGIVAPDLLGYGGTDHPSDINAFRLKKMAKEIMALLDCLGIGAVFGVAHDL